MADELAPPQFAIDAAVLAGAGAPCAKSRRGCAVFDPIEGVVLSTGHNGQASPRECRGDEACRKACTKLCCHAELRAIVSGLIEVAAQDGELARSQRLSGYELVHAKVKDGQLVAGGGPSCWQCSREVLENKLDAVWLYQETPEEWCPHLDLHVHDCPLCQGEACELCDRGSRCHRDPGRSRCDHDVLDRHDGLSIVNARWRRYNAVTFDRLTQIDREHKERTGQ